MLTYQVSAADRLPLPHHYTTEPRHLGFDDVENRRPFAHYYCRDARAVQEHVVQTLLAGASPPEYGYEVGDAANRLSAQGYHKMETGWTRTDRGTVVVACHTDMPGVTAEMWDWWFGWHMTDTARYKLWHPDAHQFSAAGENRSHDRSLTDRQRYLNNVSYVDEYIGATLARLAIRFVDPGRLGFADRTGFTHVCARVGASDLPVATGWLIHQVRPTEHGSEMRSRFFLGHATILDVPAHSVSRPTAARLLTSRPGRIALAPAVSAAGRRTTGIRIGRDLLHHCATEMNHLAAFLPDLFAEFRDTP